jgi:SAM-dependent methyltransferase
MTRRRWTVQAWLQERQYATPYHWNQNGNDAIEYQLRTTIVLGMAGLPPNGSGIAPAPGARPRVRLLDVGCGDARFLADAAVHGNAVGIDVSRRALGHAERLVHDARFVRSAGEALPFADRSFQVVTLLDVIEHIPDEDESSVIGEARRVLKRGGRLIVSTNTDRSAREPKHFRHYPLARFLELFEGFDDIRLVGLVPYVPTLRFWMAAPIVSRWLRSRVRTCEPERAQTVIGVGVKP